MIETIEHRGVLIRECPFPGEDRASQTVPAHPNGIQLSVDRWLILYATRKFRGTDDDTSIVYQVRGGTPYGEVLSERLLARSTDAWDPDGSGRNRYVKQHGHPVAFGVPRGALIGGRPAPNANLFVLKWRMKARVIDRDRNFLEIPESHRAVAERAAGVTAPEVAQVIASYVSATQEAQRRAWPLLARAAGAPREAWLDNLPHHHPF